MHAVHKIGKIPEMVDVDGATQLGFGSLNHDQGLLRRRDWVIRLKIVADGSRLARGCRIGLRRWRRDGGLRPRRRFHNGRLRRGSGRRDLRRVCLSGQ